MKNRQIDVLRGAHTVTFPVPSTIEEGDNMVGEVGAVLEGFIDDNLYRNTLPRFYKEVSKKLKDNGEAPKQLTDDAGNPQTVKRKDGTVKPVMESALIHVERVLNEASDERKAEIRQIMEQTASETPFFVKGERGGFGKVSQSALDAANGFFAEGDERVETVISTIESNVPGYKVLRDEEGNATPESVARGVQALNKHMEAQAKKQVEGILAKK